MGRKVVRSGQPMTTIRAAFSGEQQTAAHTIESQIAARS
jgi:hypothetical protein